MSSHSDLKLWHWLLKKARIHPIITGLGIFIFLSAIGLLLGQLVDLYQEQFGGVLEWIEKASNVIGWFALMGAYALALLAWAHRKEAAISFYGAGIEVDKIKEAFDASLILTSRRSQTEWHLRHLRPKRVEFVWTPMLEEKTKELLNLFPNLECIESHCRGLSSNQDAYEIRKVKRHCLSLLEGILDKYPKQKVCVDLTAGTALMTVAAFQAAEELGVTSIYLVGKTHSDTGYILDDNKVDDPHEAKVVIVSDHRNDK
jgi:hypothetical protein